MLFYTHKPPLSTSSTPWNWTSGPPTLNTLNPIRASLVSAFIPTGSNGLTLISSSTFPPSMIGDTVPSLSSTWMPWMVESPSYRNQIFLKLIFSGRLSVTSLDGQAKFVTFANLDRGSGLPMYGKYLGAGRLTMKACRMSWWLLEY